MQAVVHEEYGSFEGLSVREIDRPFPGDEDVLVRVRAAGLHIGDCFGVRGAPFAMRMVSGLFKPKIGIPGFDVAGTVEAVGAAVTGFGPGDAVFGASDSAAGCAQFVCRPQGELAAKPAKLSFEEAAAMPTSGLAALHALRDVARLQAGQRVLINGASGGVGTFAVQIAKSMGAEVTGVCSARNVDLVRALGADHVIDYTRRDFATGEQRYDLVFDNVENRPLSEVRRALTPRGTLILNSGTGARGWALLTRLIKPLLVSPFVGQSLRRYLSVSNQADLSELAKLVDTGLLEPVIDKTYPLAETAAALGYIEQGHARGKVVVTV